MTTPTPEQGLRDRIDLEQERLRTEAGTNFTRYSLTRLHPSLTKRQVRFGIWNAPQIELNDPVYFVVRQEHLGRLDNISFQFYDDPRLWWAIAHVNQIRNQFTDMQVGMTLVIPQKESILAAIETGSDALFEN